MPGPFRDDTEASHARAEALAGEVEELKAERDALLAEKAAQPAPPALAPQLAPAEPAAVPAPVAPAQGGRRYRMSGTLFAVATCAFVAVVIVLGVRRDSERARAAAARSAAIVERNASRERWRDLLVTEPCVRAVEADEWNARHAMAGGVRRSPHGAAAYLRALQTNCLDGPSRLHGGSSTLPAAQSALGAWLDAEPEVGSSARALYLYLSKDDWKEDDLRGFDPLWARVTTALDRRALALAAVRRDALPVLRDQIRAQRVAHEATHGRDELAWRVDLGLGIWDVADAAWRSLKEPASDDARQALHDAVSTVLQQAGHAPIEVRRDVRTLDLDFITKASVAGSPSRDETLEYLMGADLDVLRKMGDDILDLDAPRR